MLTCCNGVGVAGWNDWTGSGKEGEAGENGASAEGGRKRRRLDFTWRKEQEEYVDEEEREEEWG